MHALNEVTHVLDFLPPGLLLQIYSLNVSLGVPAGEGPIKKALEQTVLLGGKRLRPLLIFLMGDFFGVKRKKLVPYARAIEMVHGASLSHDDVIDEATTRRGRPSINVKTSNQKSVLAGDYLLATVIEELSQEGNLEILQRLSRVIKDLATGEWLQLEKRWISDYDFSHIEKIALFKTASLMSWCCEVPARLLQVEPTIIEKVSKLGVSLGLAFQYMDDIIDISKKATGKEAGIDLKNGVLNAVFFEQGKIDTSFRKLFIGANLDNADALKSISDIDFSESVTKVRDRAQGHFRQIRALLGELHIYLEHSAFKHGAISQVHDQILSLVDYLENRES